MPESEVAQLKQRIEEEISSMYLLMDGPAVVSKHELINHKYRNLGTYQQELAQLVGEQSAAHIVDEAYDQVMEEGDEPCNHHA
jgi:hypothetical protein